jgi:hypothetical protein
MVIRWALVVCILLACAPALAKEPSVATAPKPTDSDWGGSATAGADSVTCRLPEVPLAVSFRPADPASSFTWTAPNGQKRIIRDDFAICIDMRTLQLGPSAVAKMMAISTPVEANITSSGPTKPAVALASPTPH